MNGRIIKIFSLMTCLLSLNVMASSISDRDLYKWKKSLNKTLPKSLKTYKDIYFWPQKSGRDFCVAEKKDPYNHDDSHPHEKDIFINPDCVTQIERREIKSHKFNHKNMINSKFKRELINVIVESELPFKLRRKKYKRNLFNNNFFKTPWTIGVDIKTSLADANKNFYKSSVAHYMSNPNFYKTSPCAYDYLKEKLFKGKTYFSVNADVKALCSKDIYINTGKVKLLTEGNETFWTRYHMIESAQKSIYLSYFALFHDVYGKALLGLILEKLKKNPKLDVVILLDGKGTFKSHGSLHIKQLIAYGAKVKVYNPVFINLASLWRTLKVGLVDGIVSSNHDKILLVDEVYFTTGGRNIADKYFVEHGEIDSFVFKDTDVFIKFDKSPISVIKAIFTEFDTFFARRIWSNRNIDAEKELEVALAAVRDRINNEYLKYETINNFPELERHKSLYGYKEWFLEYSAESYPIIGLDSTSKLQNINELSASLFQLIDEAQDEIVIQNPYVVLTEKMMKKLIEADRRGVKIIISTSSHVSTDSRLTVNHLRDNWREIMTLLPNARIFGYLGPEKTHSKTFVFDRKKTVVGSYNLDILSESLNSEFAVVIESEEFAKENLHYAKTVLDNSYEYKLEGDLGPHTIPGERSKKIYKQNQGLGWEVLGWISGPWL